MRSNLNMNNITIILSIPLLLLFAGCSQFEYDYDISLNEVDLGTHIYGPKVTLEDLHNKVVLLQIWDSNTRNHIPDLVELQKKYGRDDLVVIINSSDKLFSIPTEAEIKRARRNSGAIVSHELPFKNDIDEIEGRKKRWQNFGGTDDVSVVIGMDLGYPEISVQFTTIFDSDGKQVWNGDQGWRKPLNSNIIDAVNDAIEDKHEKNL